MPYHVFVMPLITTNLFDEKMGNVWDIEPLSVWKFLRYLLFEH